jgi:hypothetical protein
MAKTGTNRAPVAVETRRVKKTDGFMITPNDLIRGDGIYAGLCPEERIILMGGLSCRDGYETTLDRIEGWLADASGKVPGRNRQEAYRRTLRERGFLKTVRGNIPAGRPDGGRLRWTYTFFEEPLGIEQRDDLQAKKHHAADGDDEPGGFDEPDDETAAQTMPPNPGHGGPVNPETGKTPGQTMPPSPGHGSPGHGGPGPGGDRVYKEEKNHPEKNQGKEEKEDQNPPPRSNRSTHYATADDSAPVDESPSEPVDDKGGDSSQNPDPAPTSSGLTALVASLTALSPGWNPEDTREVLEALRTRGTAPAEIIRVATEVASGQHGETRSPRRLLVWWPTPPKAAEPEPEWVKGSINYLAPGTPICRSHPGEPEIGCGKCKVEKFRSAGDDQAESGPLPAADGQSAKEIAMALARAAKTSATVRPRRAEPVDEARTPAPSAFGEVLAQLTEKIGADA